MSTRALASCSTVELCLVVGFPSDEDEKCQQNTINHTHGGENKDRDFIVGFVDFFIGARADNISEGYGNRRAAKDDNNN